MDGKDILRYNVLTITPRYCLFHGIFHMLDMLGKSMIIGIDINGKLCRRIESPHRVPYHRVAYLQFLGLFGGHLRYACNSTKEVVVWAMEAITAMDGLKALD